jgi:predicted RNA-binding protein (virulence factor B family)
MKHHQHIVSVWLKQIGKKLNILLQLDEDGHVLTLYTIWKQIQHTLFPKLSKAVEYHPATTMKAIFYV